MVNNIRLNNGKSLLWKPPQLLIRSDASKEGWGAYCQGKRTGGPWSERERDLHINLLELKAANFAILTFTQNKKNLNSIHIQMDSMVALSYLVKMGGTNNQELVRISKQIWNYLISRGITLTAEHLPGILNKEADFESRNVKGLQRVETKQADISTTLSDIREPRDRSFCFKGVETTKEILCLENRPLQFRERCVSGKLVPGLELCFPPVQSNRESSSKGSKGTVNPDLHYTSMANSVLVPKTHGDCYSNSNSSSLLRKSLKQSQTRNSSIIRKPLLKTPGMESFREKLSSEGISERASNLISSAEEMEQTLITNRPGESSIVGVVRDRLIPLHVMYL